MMICAIERSALASFTNVSPKANPVTVASMKRMPREFSLRAGREGMGFAKEIGAL